MQSLRVQSGFCCLQPPGAHPRRVGTGTQAYYTTLPSSVNYSWAFMLMMAWPAQAYYTTLPSSVNPSTPNPIPAGNITPSASR
jgi:hypothetical protein